jgi:hypothetical protein
MLVDFTLAKMASAEVDCRHITAMVPKKERVFKRRDFIRENSFV